MKEKVTEKTARFIVEDFKEKKDIKKFIGEVVDYASWYGRCSKASRLNFKEALINQIDKTFYSK